MNPQTSKEKKTLIVIVLTVITMIAEIVTGYISHSMALLADGFHMGTHGLALGIAYAAYWFTRKMADSDKFAFGTGKFGVLAGYTSSIFLGLTGVWIIIESVDRFIHPLDIQFNEAIFVAVIGLIVNVVCILIMGGENHEHRHGACEDHNFKAAYLHILADILTSVFAIIALLAVRFLGWHFFDPVIGIVGGLVIIKWSYGLITSTGGILLDRSDKCLSDKIKNIFVENGAEVLNLRVWKTGSEEIAVNAKIHPKDNQTAEFFQTEIEKLVENPYLNIEIC